VSELSTADRLAIAEVISRYCHCVDRGRWEELETIFTADCTLDLSQVMGLYEGREGLRRFAGTLAPLGLLMRHLTVNVVIEGDGERARAESYVLAITGSAGNVNQTTGLYADEFVKQTGRWLIRTRRLTLDVPRT
jgi:hypothetical protein